MLHNQPSPNIWNLKIQQIESVLLFIDNPWKQWKDRKSTKASTGNCGTILTSPSQLLLPIEKLYQQQQPLISSSTFFRLWFSEKIELQQEEEEERKKERKKERRRRWELQWEGLICWVKKRRWWESVCRRVKPSQTTSSPFSVHSTTVSPPSKPPCVQLRYPFSSSPQ